MTAILQLVLKYLPQLVQATNAVPELIAFISGLKAIFSRHDVWTPEAEAKFDAETEALRSDPAWIVNDE